MKYSELFKLLKKDGWLITRQTGSHVIMLHPTKSQQLTVPVMAAKRLKKVFAMQY